MPFERLPRKGVQEGAQPESGAEAEVGPLKFQQLGEERGRGEVAVGEAAVEV
jgi:hypothetical protein